ncbi:MAG: M23 family metallopeptidase [Thermomonas sp.]|uniref:M23 family metallopeptidase n=1 Tax=Thermomonas sp. TaxID=1971895 RepID=UPI002605A8A6|nr:M23 family metallopeptidase [Thermomonas sp.]MCC7097327.1 M23 family metallopeptidase [Thermomonas sp.]
MRQLLLATCLLLCVAPAALAHDPPPTTTRDAVARLRIVAVDGGFLAYADNLLPGPVEVRLDVASGARPQAEPALPARAGIAAGASVLLTRLQRPPGNEGRLQLRLRGVPGSSNAKPRDVLYLLPLQQATPRIDQGFDGAYSHNDDENRDALDFAAPIGTPVLAARSGIVLQVETGFREHGTDAARDAARANYIRILHDDGSMALYGHLAPGGAMVVVGQQVEAGERIGSSGNTGYSTAPHLHFVVQVNRGGQLLSIPFRMQGVALAHASGMR